MQVEIVEVAPRDGLQNEPVTLSTSQKVDLISQLVAAGARRIEATSFVNPTLVPQLADAEALMNSIPRTPDVSYIGLALNERGVDRAISAGCSEINFVVVASDTFSMKNQGMGTGAALEVLAQVLPRIQAADLRATLTVGAAFGCPFEGVVSTARVRRIAARARDLGVDELALADTVGVAVPKDIHRLVSGVAHELGSMNLRLHLHDTRHAGIANSQAAIDSGVRTLDSSMGGIGGCPFAPNAAGNVATEDLLYLLDRSDVEHGWSLDVAPDIVRWLENALGSLVPGLAAKAGPFPA